MDADRVNPNATYTLMFYGDCPNPDKTLHLFLRLSGKELTALMTHLHTWLQTQA